jgi:hypothetical protein
MSPGDRAAVLLYASTDGPFVDAFGAGVMKTFASSSLAFAALLCGLAVGQQAAAQSPQTELAAQIRTQGYTCDKALGATRDKKQSRPDHDVWVLKCSNATYRVSRFPDLAAKVEVLP